MQCHRQLQQGTTRTQSLLVGTAFSYPKLLNSSSSCCSSTSGQVACHAVAVNHTAAENLAGSTYTTTQVCHCFCHLCRLLRLPSCCFRCFVCPCCIWPARPQICNPETMPHRKIVLEWQVACPLALLSASAKTCMSWAHLLLPLLLLHLVLDLPFGPCARGLEIFAEHRVVQLGDFSTQALIVLQTPRNGAFRSPDAPSVA